MDVKATIIEGCYELTPAVFGDDRGYFFESFQVERLKKAIPNFPDFVQDNEAYSANIGVVRGLHAQKGESAQAKLVRVVKGAVIDVVVDIRKDSPSFGKHIAVALTEQNKKQLLVPRGCLHGYSVLEEHTIFVYKCDNYYNKSAEISAFVNDPALNIDWGIRPENMQLSEKDAQAMSFQELVATL